MAELKQHKFPMKRVWRRKNDDKKDVVSVMRA